MSITNALSEYNRILLQSPRIPVAAYFDPFADHTSESLAKASQDMLLFEQRMKEYEVNQKLFNEKLAIAADKLRLACLQAYDMDPYDPVGTLAVYSNAMNSENSTMEQKVVVFIKNMEIINLYLRHKA